MTLPTKEQADAALAETMRALTRHSRVPFRSILADLIGAQPTVEALRAFAARYPDKWAQAVTLFANLSGYEKGLIEVNVFNVGNMSDAQLLAEHGRMEASLRELGVAVPAYPIDVTPVVVPVQQTTTVPTEAPRPAAERDAAGDYVNPAEAV